MSKTTRILFLRLFLVGSALMASACSFGTLPPPEMPPPPLPPGPGGPTCSEGVHIWENFHLAHDSLTVVVVNESGYTPDLESWNDLDTPIMLVLEGDGFRIYIREGGDANSGWLGLASVRVDGRGHIISATVTMNRTLLSKYGPNVAAHVLAQEIGHLLGLGHQRNAVPPSALDDCQGRPRGEWLACLSDPAGVVPNEHDAEQLREIYAHVGGPRAPPEACGTGEATYRVHTFTVPGGGDDHCHDDSTCESTAEEIENVRNGSDRIDTEEGIAARRDGAGGGHSGGPPESSDGVHRRGPRGDGGGNARDAEENGLNAGEPEARPVDPVVQLWLARAAVGECNFSLPDCPAAVWHTLQRRWLNLVLPRWPDYTLDRMARQYCAVFKGKSEKRKRWVRGLVADGSEPDGWPDAASWEVHGPHWEAIHDMAGEFLRGNIKDPCKGSPVHLGGRIDRWKMHPDKWAVVHCGDTGNQMFWVLKS